METLSLCFEGLRKPSDTRIISVDLPLLIGRLLDGRCLVVGLYLSWPQGRSGVKVVPG